MKNFPNIDTRKPPGCSHYVGYGRLISVWHINGKSGNWYVTPARDPNGVPFFANTLSEVSSKLFCR